ncbi:hypothetical protein SAMN06295912_10991 [Sphingomonas laterariae]|uniref:Uncharacterized protein n=1 Tax=Edaphosphingomonas laterariae TaxID=861865 RepID=A0A239FKA5_9SPHN|nr:hypothetical protein [Sphingomonas laterariae]SNS57360.1 hypothetical protein SAMN06295912_10991 [Sphingomonas laterariae]
MILPGLLFLALQAPASSASAAKPAAAKAIAPVEKLKVIDSALALDTFKLTCWEALRDPTALQAAVMMAPIPLAAQSKAGSPSKSAESYRSDQAILTYAASDNLPANIPARQCTLIVRLAGAADQLALAARIQQALALPAGRTRTSAAQSQTEWNVAGADARVTRLFATTRAAPGGTTELRLAALLLAQK